MLALVVILGCVTVFAAAILLARTPGWWIPAVLVMLGAVAFLNWPREPQEDIGGLSGLESLGILLLSGGIFAIGLVMLLASAITRSLLRKRTDERAIELPRAQVR